MLTDEHRSARHPGSASMQLHGTARHTLPAALPEPQSSQILRHACAQPAAQSPGDGRTCVSSYGASLALS
eukprot:scaffold106085_cov32-Phaeocystis_antarctica.AAC.1